MDGTCTGEHGIGQGKMEYLEAEHGPEALDVMRAIKRAIDPHNIMKSGQDRLRSDAGSAVLPPNDGGSAMLSPSNRPHVGRCPDRGE